MGSKIDCIIPIAIELGKPFTARDICEKLYGDTTRSNMVNTHVKVRRLVVQGYIRECKRVRVGSQYKVFYEVIA